MLRITHEEPEFVHAPALLEAQSFWPFVHDARLVAVKLDPLTNECSLTVTSPPISERNGWDTETDYELAFPGATHVSVCEIVEKANAPAPRHYSSSSTSLEISRDSRSRLRVESRRWSDLEDALSSGGQAYLYDGGFVQSEEGAAAWFYLSLAGGNRWMDVTIAGLSFVGRITGGRIATLRELEALGRDYWDNRGRE